MRFDVLTLFPEIFSGYVSQSLLSKAIENGLVQIDLHDIRNWTLDKHQRVDDRPYGGGPGMLMKTEPLELAISAAREALPGARVIYLTPQGKPLDQQRVNELAVQESVILLCGRYEGVDERVIESQVDEEVSLGDFVLSGGELAAMACLDAMIRLQPGALGHEDSADQDSFMNGLLDCPHYTKPEDYTGKMVPPVLLSGDHEVIRVWRLKQSLGKTWQKRPDLLKKIKLTDEQQALLQQFISENETVS